MSLLTGAPVTRSLFFSDIEHGDVFWLSSDRANPHSCMAEFGPLNPNGISRDFDCVNGAWTGTLTEMDEGALELHVHKTGSRHFVYLCEKVETVEQAMKGKPSERDDEIPY
jgi:hypothetical protein